MGQNFRKTLLRLNSESYNIRIPLWTRTSVTREKSPNVYKSCPKRISLENLKILAQTQKLPKTVGDLSKLIVAKGFKKLPKVKKSLNLVTLTRTRIF